MPRKRRPSTGFLTLLCPSREVVDIQNIIEAIRMNRIRVSDHADEETEADGLSFDEICFSVVHGEIISRHMPRASRPPLCVPHTSFRHSRGTSTGN